MYLLENKQFKREIVPKTFAELEMTEAHMENILAANLDMIFNEESMIVIGKQVKNAANGRSDLTAIDQNGNMCQRRFIFPQYSRNKIPHLSYFAGGAAG